MLGNCANCETLISVKRSSLRTAIYDEGIEFYSLQGFARAFNEEEISTVIDVVKIINVIKFD